MAEEEKKKKQGNTTAEAKNWEQRLRQEQEAPHKWNETWGSVFGDGVPHEYSKRIQHYEKIVQELPKGAIPPKYGVGGPFKEPKLHDYRRKKMFTNGGDDDDDE